MNVTKGSEGNPLKKNVNDLFVFITKVLTDDPKERKLLDAKCTQEQFNWIMSSTGRKEDISEELREEAAAAVATFATHLKQTSVLENDANAFTTLYNNQYTDWLKETSGIIETAVEEIEDLEDADTIVEDTKIEDGEVKPFKTEKERNEFIVGWQAKRGKVGEDAAILTDPINNATYSSIVGAPDNLPWKREYEQLLKAIFSNANAFALCAAPYNKWVLDGAPFSPMTGNPIVEHDNAHTASKLTAQVNDMYQFLNTGWFHSMSQGEFLPKAKEQKSTSDNVKKVDNPRDKEVLFTVRDVSQYIAANSDDASEVLDRVLGRYEFTRGMFTSKDLKDLSLVALAIKTAVERMNTTK